MEALDYPDYLVKLTGKENTLTYIFFNSWLEQGFPNLFISDPCIQLLININKKIFCLCGFYMLIFIGLEI